MKKIKIMNKLMKKIIKIMKNKKKNSKIKKKRTFFEPFRNLTDSQLGFTGVMEFPSGNKNFEFGNVRIMFKPQNAFTSHKLRIELLRRVRGRVGRNFLIKRLNRRRLVNQRIELI